MRQLSWTRDNDYIFGPVIFARDKHQGFHIGISSRCPNYSNGASFRLSVFSVTVIVMLPDWLIRPSNGEYEIIENEFSINFRQGWFHFNHGKQTHCSSTNDSSAWEVPFLNWRFDSTEYLNFEQKLIKKFPRGTPFDVTRNFEESLPKMVFIFSDFDGEVIEAAARIVRQKWKFGLRKFAWLSWFRRAKVSTSMNLKFSREIGKEKGSWKGGTIGHSIEIFENENMEQAFRRYSNQNDLKMH